MKKLIPLFVLVITQLNFFAQDAQFTQFNASPLYLNPAFTGATDQHRFTAVYRNQWPGIKRSYSSYMASYDYNLNEYNLGIGGYVLQDITAAANLVSTHAGLNVAYKIKTGISSDIRGGILLGMCQKKVDQGKLYFNDQFITGSSVSQDAVSINSINYLDLGFGAVYTSKKFWGGFSTKHLNKPNASMNGDVDKLPVYLSLHGGYRFNISAPDTGSKKQGQWLSVLMNYRHQSVNDQLDIGVNYQYKIINGGLWYRGLPLKNYKPGYPTRESLALVAGVQVPGQNLKIAYSYDFTISNLGSQTTGGAHEVTLAYEVGKKKVKRMAKGKSIIKQKF